MSAAYPVELNQLESLYLSDAITMFTQGPPDSSLGQAPPYPNLLLKIGGAVLETHQLTAPVIVRFSLSELWVLREVTKSSIVVGDEHVGLYLLLKIYKGIRALVAETDIQSVVNSLGEVFDNDRSKKTYIAQFEQGKGAEDPKIGRKSDSGGFDENSRSNQLSNSDNSGFGHNNAAELAGPLTGREIEILRLIAAGMRNQEIADHLFIRLGTVKRHIANSYGKLGASDRNEAIAHANKLNLL